MALKTRLRRLPTKEQLRVKKFFGSTYYNKSQKNFAYQINQQSVRRRITQNSQRGIL